MAQASALGRCTHHLAGQQTMPSAGDVFVCAPRADIAWAGGSRVGCHHWRRHLGGSLPLFSGVNAARVALAAVMQGINLRATTLSPSLSPDDTADVVL